MNKSKKREESNNNDHKKHIKEFSRRFWISLVLTIPVLLFSESIQNWFNFIIIFPLQKEIVSSFSTIIYFYGGYPFLRGMIKEIGNREPGMMTLIGFAISVAFFYSISTLFFIEGDTFFWELATLIDVMLLGHWIESKSVMGASRALQELVKIIPKKAHIIEDSNIRDIPISELKKGDIVLVKPGEKIPSDGIITQGESYINESLVTGESKPVHKKRNDEVIGGSINEEGKLEVKIEKTGEDTFISRVINMVKEAKETKSKTQNLADRAAAMLFYVALSAGIVTFIVWYILNTPHFALTRTVTVLVIACPHALGLAIPLVVAITTSLSARNGILIRERNSFEKARSIDAVIYDKTGTLTEGDFTVSEVESFIKEDELLKYASGIEVNSEHIIARAIVDYAKERNIEIPGTQAFRAIPGKGVRGEINGKEIYIGNHDLLEEIEVELDKRDTEKYRKKGKTTVFVVFDNEVKGVFILSDKIKEDSYKAVKKLNKKGIDVFMLTGDSEESAEWVAEELGIIDYFAEVLPEDKSEKVGYLQEKGYLVAMVGDGINDAPALVKSDIGIAIGAGTDVAIESADIVLVKNNPNDVPEIIDLSQKTYSKMVQNLWWAAGYNIIAIPLASGLLYNLGILVQPAIGALVMSISTVIVAINAQTLRRYRI